MDNHYEVGDIRGNSLKQTVAKLTLALSELDAHFKVMDTTKDGDGSNKSHFDKTVVLYDVQGVDKNAVAKSIYDEMNSAVENSAALRQLLARLG